MTDPQAADVGVVEQMAPYAQAEANVGFIMKEGTPATHDRGVLFLGPWQKAGDGFSEHVRRQARALSLADVPVHLRAPAARVQETTKDERALMAAYQDLAMKSVGTYGAQVNMVVPHSDYLTKLVRGSLRHYSVDQQAHINAHRAVYTVWERQAGMSPGDVAAFNACGQAWVASNQAKALLANSGVETDTRVFPCPFFPDDPHLAFNERERSRGPVTFYHVGKWEPRKAQHQMLGSFLRAVKPGEALFVLKTSSRFPVTDGEYPDSPADSLAHWLDNDAAVRANGWSRESINRGVILIASFISEEKMLALHRTGDVYLTLSRGEGFDMPAFDAKLSGNLMVYTPSGGPQDFAGELDQRVESTGTVPADPFYDWPEDATYLDYDMDAAAAAIQAAMKEVRDGRRIRGVSLAGFEAHSVGAAMARALDEIGWRGDPG